MTSTSDDMRANAITIGPSAPRSPLLPFEFPIVGVVDRLPAGDVRLSLDDLRGQVVEAAVLVVQFRQAQLREATALLEHLKAEIAADGSIKWMHLRLPFCASGCDFRGKNDTCAHLSQPRVSSRTARTGLPPSGGPATVIADSVFSAYTKQ